MREHIHRGYKVYLKECGGAWIASCTALPKPGTTWRIRPEKDDALKAICNIIDEFCLNAVNDA